MIAVELLKASRETRTAASPAVRRPRTISNTVIRARRLVSAQAPARDYAIDHRQALKHGGSDQITRSDLNGSIGGRDDGRRSPRTFRPNSTGTAIHAQVHSRLAAQSAQKGAKERRAPTLSRSAPRKGIDDMMKWGSIIIPPKGGGM